MKLALSYCRLATSFGLITAVLALSACGGGGGGDTGTQGYTPPTTVSSTSTVSSQASSAVSSAAVSSAPSINTPQNKPSMPSSLEATAIYSTRVTLVWQASTSANPVTSYRLTRNGVVIGTTEGAGTSYTDTQLNPESQYTYRVQGGDAQGNWSSLSMGLSIRTAPPGNDPILPPEPDEPDEPPQSSSSGNASSTSSRSSKSASSASSAPGVNVGVDASPPSRPNGLEAVSVKDTSIDLVWNAASDNVGVTRYRVMRNGEVIGTVSGQSQAFLDTELMANTQYNYTVQAGDAAGNWSLVSASFGVKTTAPSKQGALLTWSHPTQRENGEYLELSDIGGYELRYRENSLDAFKSIPIAGSHTTSYALNDLPSNYDFQIAVYDSNGLYSNYVTLTPR